MIILVIVVIVIITIIAIYNSLVTKSKAVQKAKATIDVYLTQRFSLIPNLVEVVKGYSKHEKETLEELIKIREGSKNTNLKIEEEANLNTRLNNLIIKVENYPDLKADENYLELQKQLSKMESQIQAARRIYNMDVETYNVAITTFPNSLIANMFNFKEAKFFEAKLEEKESVNISI